MCFGRNTWLPTCSVRKKNNHPNTCLCFTSCCCLLQLWHMECCRWLLETHCPHLNWRRYALCVYVSVRSTCIPSTHAKALRALPIPNRTDACCCRIGPCKLVSCNSHALWRSFFKGVSNAIRQPLDQHNRSCGLPASSCPAAPHPLRGGRSCRLPYHKLPDASWYHTR